MTKREALELVDVPGLPPSIARTVERLTAPKRRSARVVAARKATKATKSADRTARISRRAAVRDAAMLRDEERCVICRFPDAQKSLHMHHILGRRDERLETVAMLCEWHHEGPSSVHAGSLSTLRDLAAWAVERGYADAARALAKRISRIEDTRRAAEARRGEGR